MARTQRRIAHAFCTLSLFTFLGCNVRDQRELAEDTKRLADTAGRSVTNASLAGKVNTVLSLWKGIDMNSLTIQAENGVVTLEGTVKDRAERRKIAEVVNQIKGVEKCVDHLKVKDAP